MAPHRSAKSTGRVSTPAHLSALPEGSDLRDYVSLPEVSLRVGVSDKTLLKWARDPEHDCPPVYELGPKKRLMEWPAVESWIKSRRLGRDESDARAS